MDSRRGPRPGALARALPVSRYRSEHRDGRPSFQGRQEGYFAAICAKLAEFAAHWAKAHQAARSSCRDRKASIDGSLEQATFIRIQVLGA